MRCRLSYYYEYVYCKLYAWQILLHKGKYHPERSAWFTISFLGYLNFLVLIILSQIFVGHGFTDLHNANINILILGSIFIALNYFKFIHKGKYKKMNIRFNQQTKKQNIIGTFFVWIYIIGSFAMVIISAQILKSFNH